MPGPKIRRQPGAFPVSILPGLRHDREEFGRKAGPMKSLNFYNRYVLQAEYSDFTARCAP